MIVTFRLRPYQRSFKVVKDSAPMCHFVAQRCARVRGSVLLSITSVDVAVERNPMKVVCVAGIRRGDYDKTK